MTSTIWLIGGALLSIAMYFAARNGEKNKGYHGSGRKDWRTSDQILMIALSVMWFINAVGYSLHMSSFGSFITQVVILCGMLTGLILGSRPIAQALIARVVSRLLGIKNRNPDVIRQHRLIMSLLPKSSPIAAQVETIVNNVLPELDARFSAISKKIVRVNELIEQGKKRGSDTSRQQRSLKKLRDHRDKIYRRQTQCLGFLDTVEALLLSNIDGNLPDITDDFERLMHSIEEDQDHRREAEEEVDGHAHSIAHHTQARAQGA